MHRSGQIWLRYWCSVHQRCSRIAPCLRRSAHLKSRQAHYLTGSAMRFASIPVSIGSRPFGSWRAKVGFWDVCSRCCGWITRHLDRAALTSKYRKLSSMMPTGVRFPGGRRSARGQVKAAPLIPMTGDRRRGHPGIQRPASDYRSVLPQSRVPRKSDAVAQQPTKIQ